MKNFIIDLLILIGVTSIAILTVTASYQWSINKDDVILESNKETITVKRYENKLNWDKKEERVFITKDSTILKFKQRHILMEGKVTYYTHHRNDEGKEHYITVKDKNKNKNISSPEGLSCSMIDWCRRNEGEEIKFAKEYYPKERYIIITKDNEIID